jgi:MFS family permease
MKRKKAKPKSKSKAPVVFATSALLNDLGSDAIKPFWPTFVTSVLGAPTYILGILDGIGEAIAYGIRWPAGYIADRYRKKPMVWLGYLMAGLSRIGYSISKAASWLFPFKAMDRLGKLRDPPRDAMLAREVSKKERGRAFGLLTAMDNIGAMLAPLFGLLLFSLFSYRTTFAIAAIPSIISSLLIFALIKEKNKKKNDIQHIQQTGSKSKQTKAFSKEFKKYVAFTFIFALGWISNSFMLLFAGLKGIDVKLFPIFLFITSAMAVVASYSLGKLSDKLGRKKAILLGYAIHSLMLLGFLSFYFFTLPKSLTFALLLLLFALYGFGFGAITAMQPAFAIDLAEKRPAEASGILATFFGFSAFLASTIAGILWQISPALTFGFAAFAAITGNVLILFVRHK